jgi:uncharacterized membrane protein
MGFLYLKERLTKAKVVGLGLIMVGTVVLGLS